MPTPSQNLTTRPVAPSTSGVYRCAATDPITDPITERGSRPTGGPTVLIVESDLAVRLMLANSFDTAGYNVQLAPDLATAQAATSAESTNEPPSLLVIADVVGGASGLEFIHLLAEANPEAPIPVILLSNASHRLKLSGLMQTGVRHVVGKPCSCREILSYAADLVGFSGPNAAESDGQTGGGMGEVSTTASLPNRRAA